MSVCEIVIKYFLRPFTSFITPFDNFTEPFSNFAPFCWMTFCRGWAVVRVSISSTVIADTRPTASTQEHQQFVNQRHSSRGTRRLPHQPSPPSSVSVVLFFTIFVLLSFLGTILNLLLFSLLLFSNYWIYRPSATNVNFHDMHFHDPFRFLSTLNAF